MRQISFERHGAPDVLRITESEIPSPRAREVLIAVEAAGISHADLMQRQGNYPPPPDASPVLGLEVAGRISAIGSEVTQWRAGDRVCALTNGGGYAEYVAVAQGQVLPVPEGWNMVEAATLPENAFTVYDNMVTRARLQAGEMVLVHGGTSGIGTTALMFAKALGARSIATAGSEAKCAATLKLGAVEAINYRTHDFVEEVLRTTHGRGVDVVVDIVGGEYIGRDIKCLALDGRIACIATALGRTATIDLGRLFAKRATILGSSLRPRTAEQKAAIARALREHIWPLLPRRDPIVPVIDTVYPFERAADAHARLESSQHIGKIVLVPRGPTPR